MNKTDNSEKMRRISLAVAEWLCGTLEGFADDNDDMNCAEALDSWIRTQKKNMETLFIGTFTCPNCSKAWHGLTLSENKNSFHCPNCGSIQKITSENSDAARLPENIDKLKTIQQETSEIVQKIDTLNCLLLKYQI
jgi:ssDNA-binding Zn-finger/Zn-ribbon topoisomerase 1